MDKMKTGFKFGKNPVQVLKKTGTIKHAGRRYDVLRVRADGQEYVSQRLYNDRGKFIKQFMVEPAVAPQMGAILGNVHLEDALRETENKAWQALAKYKFMMFGYWAAIWVHLNQIGKFRRQNPWRHVVKLARENITREANHV